ncbi:hypothetical protein [Streptococcus parauberis]|uniref:hypothetical protein n=1 Tax=Streptococcus parauberis TaxID=1348 RepID=UPI000C15030A|nr:hypothetical protein [Streptococcus parauberis]PIA85352.1 hypothetical protein ADO07_00698 [Streptococcus parauberis]PNY22132.1 hypothetical protein ASN88_00754 [Streptococcus parauberis]
MLNTHTETDEKMLNVAHELSELLVGHSYDKAWEKAGELNSLLKRREELTLQGYMVDMIAQHLKSYYYQNNVVSKDHTTISAIGHKLEEFK